MIDVVFYGSGSLAREIYDFEINQVRKRFNFIGYINDSGEDEEFESITSLGRINLSDVGEGAQFLLCIADANVRINILKKLKSINKTLCTYIHPTSLISHSSHLGEGCIIYPFVVISSNAHLGRSVVVNSYSGIGHDVKIGDCCTISAQVDLTGFVSLGDCCFLGSGARVAPKKKIGSNSKIGTGIAVIRSLKENSIILPLPNKVYND